MAASVTTSTSTLEASPPVALFQTRIALGYNQTVKHEYAVSRDGRFLVDQSSEASVTAPITVVLNWNPERSR
jgi:hypothetical protein